MLAVAMDFGEHWANEVSNEIYKISASLQARSFFPLAYNLNSQLLTLNS